ncbi:MAG TPA: class I SAM-dependent methyltransferase [Zeimonas sp.]|nr:class I SAM-dependent methyltransferase [Zeimonas sp.]
MSKAKVLEFQSKYDAGHSAEYFHKHQRGLRRRLTTWGERRMLRKALHVAGDPASVLDLPCGAGRFWPVLAERPDRRILAADASSDMVETARRFQAPELVRRVRSFQASAFAIGLPDAAVEAIVCMRLLHHIGDAADRRRMLAEFHRVAADTVCVSCWVDGNVQARRRTRLEARRPGRGYRNRFVFERSMIEEEMRAAGFDIVTHYDLLPGISMWRLYVLRKRAA